jgi:hypothetical protein
LSGEEKLGGGQIADVVPHTRRVEIEQKLSVFSYVAIDYRVARAQSVVRKYPTDSVD